MPDWKNLVRERIASLRLNAVAESELAEEIAQHLEDDYRVLISGGEGEEEAYRKVISELDNIIPPAGGGAKESAYGEIRCGASRRRKARQCHVFC